MFAALSRARRFGRGAITLRFVAMPDALRPYVAYAVGRSVGGAVVRNRARRRLRVAVQASEDRLAPGAYLFGVGRDVVTMPFPELVARVVELADDARGAR